MNLQPLHFQYTPTNPDREVERPRLLRLSRPYQLAGHRFTELRLEGTLDLRYEATSLALSLWLEKARGCIQLGQLRRSEPVGSFDIVRLGGDEVRITATLTCADDFTRLDRAVVGLQLQRRLDVFASGDIL